MASRITHMVIKEFIQIFRDRRMKGLVFGAPIIQMLIFGYAVTTDVNNIRTAVYDADRSYESREFVRRFGASGYFTVTGYLDSEGEAAGLLDRGDTSMVIVIRHGFSTDIKLKRGAEAQIIADGTDSNTALVAINYATRIAGDFSADIGKVGLSTSVAAIDLRARVWYNPDLKSRNYNVPGVMAILIMLVSLLLTSMAIVREREIGTMEQLIVTPLRPVELMLGKTIPFAIIGFFDMLLVASVAVLWYEIPIKGSLPLLTLCTGLFLLSTLSLGLLLSTVAGTQQQAMMATFLIFSPAVLLSGFMFPVENMPLFFQYITIFNPLRHFLVIIRGIFLKGTGIDILWPEAAILLLLGITFLFISSFRFRKNIG